MTYHAYYLTNLGFFWLYGELDHDILYEMVGVGISGCSLPSQLRSFWCFPGVWYGSLVFMIPAKAIRFYFQL